MATEVKFASPEEVEAVRKELSAIADELFAFTSRLSTLSLTLSDKPWQLANRIDEAAYKLKPKS